MATHDNNVVKISGDIFCEFLEVAIHNILYIRELYPQGIFRLKKKYRVPLQVCCQPEVTKYIGELVQSVRPLLDRGQVQRVDVVIVGSAGQSLERFVFELATPLAVSMNHDYAEQEAQLRQDLLLHVEQALRGFLLKLSLSDASLIDLPKDCSWTVQVHAKQSAIQEMMERKLIEDFTWIPAEKSELEMTSPKLTPMKACDTELIKMQLYVEESAEKS